MVRRNVPALQHDIEEKLIEHVLLEIFPTSKKGDRSLFILNLYSSPKKQHRFANLFRKTIEAAKGHPLLILGDFHAAHPTWAYTKELVKGRNLWARAQREGLILITDPSQPTRQGNSVTTDTPPGPCVRKEPG